MPDRRITIAGAGLAGSLLAALLGQRGWDVNLFEKRSDPRRAEVQGGRSINLALSTRGIHALSLAGLADEVLDLTIPMVGRMIHDLDGSTHLQPYGKDTSEVIRSVSRGGLNNILLDACDATGNVTTHFGASCVGVDFDDKTATFEFNGEQIVSSDRHLVGSDGAGSVIRQALEKSCGIHSTSDILEHSYKELTIPAAADGSHLLDKNALHIWPRNSFMLIALPNLDGTFTVTLFMPNEGPISFAEYDTSATARSLFDEYFPDALALMPEFAHDYDSNPVGMLGTVRCQPWSDDGFGLLIGDAAHAIVPFFGQGMNCSFEDCARLMSYLDNVDADLTEVAAAYETERKPDTDAIATMALQNYIEMRDSVADPNFVLKRKLSLELERLYPGRFVPRYSMVTFHRIRYSIALSRGIRQAEILEQLTSGINSLEDVDWSLAEVLVSSLDELTADDGLVSQV